MQLNHKAEPWGRRQRGMTLFMVAACLFVLLGMAALAVDLASLYVTRGEAQRAADSAALAAATSLAQSGLLAGGDTSTAEAAALAQAKDVGGENLVGNQAADIQDDDVVFDFTTNPNNPTVSVRVLRTGDRGNAMPTFFARAIGFDEVDVAAVATAEAYTPGNGGPPVGLSCLKPWILPNCDPDPAHGGDPDDCTVKFVDEDAGVVVNPGPYATGGVIGQELALKTGTPSDSPAPSKFYPLDLPVGGEPSLCPSPSQLNCNNVVNGGGGGALYKQNIACCNRNELACNQEVEIDQEPGNKVGPTESGVQCLIHQGNGASGGQDTIVTSGSSLPFPITGGDNNPNPNLRGELITSSDSVVTIPLYDGHELCPGGSCGFTVTVVGFLQVFIEEVENGGDRRVIARILNVTACGGGSSSGGGGSGVIGGGGVTPIPVRLIRTPDDISFP